MNEHKGLILAPAEDDHWQVGSGLASQRFGGQDLNPSGDWSAHIPAFESQSRTYFDTNGCAVFGTLKAWITLANYLGFTDFVPDASERYTGAFAGTTVYGTDPHIVAEVTRGMCGVIPQQLMPWTDENTMDAYYNKSQAQSLLPFGKEILKRFTFGHEWIFSFGSNYTPEQKAQMLRDALKRGSVCVSVSGNYRFVNGALTKNVGEQDSHWVMLTKENTIDDQYAPFIEQLAQNYDHNAAKLFFLSRNTEASTGFWSNIISMFQNTWRSSIR
jgi:hypothetical protein